jgi:SAM-dependent methyltransferase
MVKALVRREGTMNRLNWTTTRRILVGKHALPCAEDLLDQSNQRAGVRRGSAARLSARAVLWRAVKLRDDLLVDGFIERQIGRWIQELLTDDSVFLEVGCGDMSLRRFLPSNVCYNAFDLSLAELHPRRVLGKNANVNVALASATSIPLESNCASLIVSTECFEHIPEIDRAMDEIHRVAVPGAKLLCSIPNNYCHKYHRKARTLTMSTIGRTPASRISWPPAASDS